VNELPFHLEKGRENGLGQEATIAVITHRAFHAGWPPAMTALRLARNVFEQEQAMSSPLRTIHVAGTRDTDEAGLVVGIPFQACTQ
jgi:hypothetical protein